MTEDRLIEFLGIATLLNYGVVTLWFCLFRFFHDAMYRLHRGWFQISPEQFDAIHYLGMAIYKILVLSFFLIPWLALRFF